MSNQLTPHYSISQFLNISLNEWLDDLISHISACMHKPPSKQQIAAWQSYFPLLQKTFQIVSEVPTELVFEYEIPRERGRRPDLIVLAHDQVLILEFKGKSELRKADQLQAEGYLRDISCYHQASHHLRVSAAIVLTEKNEVLSQSFNQIVHLSGPTLADYLSGQLKDSPSPPVTSVKEWIDSDFETLPTLATSSRLIFHQKPLPQIKSALSSGIPETVEFIAELCNRAKKDLKHYLVLINGIPGSGKTLVGLQAVHQLNQAVFMSGNGPLIQVLQGQLSRAFIADIHGFLREYSDKKLPAEHIFIFDEAQRAWDHEKVRTRRPGGRSEPEDLLLLASQKEWSVVVGIIGEGQEIHLGEESGIGIWNSALENHSLDSSKKTWEIACSEKLKSYFSSEQKITFSSKLNLNTSLRTHQAGQAYKWVGLLLAGELTSCRQVIKSLKGQHYDISVIRDLALAKDHTIRLYREAEDKRYGLIASSKGKLLSRFGVDNSYNATRAVDIQAYYNQPPSAPNSCCQLTHIVTEFGCQGLELDYPIVCWNDDFIRSSEKWIDTFPNQKAKDSFKLRQNAYRVLLTRGRDGMIIFIPDDPILDETYQFIKSALQN